MSSATAMRLRQLVKDHYHGLITQASYREQRASLLDNLDAGDEVSETVTTTVSQSPPPHPPPSPSRPPSPPPDPEAAAASESAAPSRPELPRAGLMAGAAVLVVVVVGVAYYLLAGGEPGPRDDQPGDAAIPSPEEQLAAAGDGLLDGFMQQNDWSIDSLTDLALAWHGLTDEQRASAAAGSSFRSFTGRLHRRIREEAALSTAAPSARLLSMIDLAEAVGAPYRLSESLLSGTHSSPEAMQQETAAADPAVIIPDSPPEAAPPPVATGASDVPATQTQTEAEPPVSQPDAAQAVTTQPDQVAQQAVAEQATTVDDPCPARLANSRRPYCQDELRDGGVGPTMVVLQTGAFQMGSNEHDEEAPRHQVDIQHNIAMSRDEVSLAEYRIYCTAAGVDCPDDRWGGDDYPVVMVSWHDADNFAKWLSEQSGHSYRLPTEAEWEYAARAGTQTPYWFGDEITPSSAHSMVNGNISEPLPRSNRSVNRNAFRLYHVSGNVREWVADAWHPDHRGAPGDGSSRSTGQDQRKVVRGGSFKDPAASLRSAARVGVNASQQDEWTGFRVVRDIHNNAN